MKREKPNPVRMKDLYEVGVSVMEIAKLYDIGYDAAYGAVFPEKRAAQLELRRAVNCGEVDRPDTCSDCGSEGQIQAHHHDYSKPLDVHWLCPLCHAGRHVGGRNKERLHPETARAVWCVALARQVERSVLLETMTLTEIVNVYRGYLGQPPVEFARVAA